MANNLFYYFTEVQLRAGLTVSSSFPTGTLLDEQRLVLSAINETLRYLNNKYYLSFKQTEYTFATVAGQRNYNLALAPYSQTFWNVSRLARNGLLRAADEWSLKFVDYTELDALRPGLAENNEPCLYSAFGENLIIYPPGDGSSIIARYYGLHIGTSSDGLTKKLRLDAEGDLVMLADEWEDVLTVSAAAKVRGQSKVDEKYKELKTLAEDWEKTLNDMATQPGEDNGPQIVLQPYEYRGGGYNGRFYPFFSNNPGA